MPSRWGSPPRTLEHSKLSLAMPSFVGQEVRLETEPVVSGWAAGNRSHKKAANPPHAFRAVKPDLRHTLLSVHADAQPFRELTDRLPSSELSRSRALSPS